MKSSTKLSIVFVLSVSLLFSCSLLLWNAKADVSLKKIALGNDTISIRTTEDSPVVDVQLLENTDYCFVDCYAILKIHPYQDIVLPSQPDAEFDWRFEKGKPWMSGLVSYHFEILKTTESKVQIPEYGKQMVNTTCYHDDNSTYQCEVEQAVQTGSHEETRYASEYKPFAFWGETLKAGEDYVIKLAGKKNPQLGTNNIDWIPMINGLELSEWNWWNTSFQYKKQVNITDTSGQSMTDYPIIIEKFDCNGHCKTDGSDIRIANETSNSSVPFGLKKFNDTAFDLVFKVNTAGNGVTQDIYVYYGSPAASYGNVSWDFARNNIYDDFDGSSLNQDLWVNGTANGGTVAVSGSSLILSSTTGSYDRNAWVFAYGKKFNLSKYNLNLTFNLSWGTDGQNLGNFQKYGLSNQTTLANDNWKGMEFFKLDGGYSGCGGQTDDYTTLKFAVWTPSLCQNMSQFSISDIRSFNYHNLNASKANQSFTVTTVSSSLYFSHGYDNLSIFFRTSNGDRMTYNKQLTIGWVAGYIYSTPVPSYSIGNEEIGCPSDDTYINQSTKFEPADMVCYLDDFGEDGILIINSSNIVLDCNGMTLNDISGGQGVAIYNDGFNNVTVKNCKLNDYQEGMGIRSQNSILENNVLSGNDLSGMTIYDSSGVLLANNTFYSNYENGIYLDNSSDIDIFNSKVNNTWGAGIYAEYSSQIRVENSSIASNRSGACDVDLEEGDNDCTILNTTYDIAKECVVEGDLTRQWYVKANVTYKNMTGIPNAQVTARNSFDALEWTENTSSDGLTGWNVVTQYIHNDSGFYYLTPHTITASYPGFPSNSTSVNVTENRIVQLTLRNWNITFNVTSGEDGSSLDNVNIACNYSSFVQNDTTNTYGPYEFSPGWWSCEFELLEPDTYYNKTVIFNADSDKTIYVTLSKKYHLTNEEHSWIESIYACLINKNCDVYNLWNQTYEFASNIWDQFKQTNESVVVSEQTTSSVVNDTSNLTIEYLIDVPAKEDYQFLPIRIFYWFMDENNDTCYNQAKEGHNAENPFCNPLVAQTIGEVNTQINFTVDLRPSLPEGNYTIVRRIDIDPDQVWINYGHEAIGRLEVTGSSGEPEIKLSMNGNPIKHNAKNSPVQTVAQTEQPEQSTGDKTTGMVTVQQIDNVSYVAVIISVITLVLVGLMFKNSRKQAA